MPPKKAEEPPPPEELLQRHGGGFTIGGEAHWVHFTKLLESGVEVKPGMKGTLEALGDLTEEMAIDLVTVKFEDFEDNQVVQLSCLSIKPPPLDMLDTLSTGLKLPLRGVDIEKIWALGEENNFEKQSEMLQQMLGLNERFRTGRRGIICDFHLYNLVHAKSLCLTPIQAAVFHGIMEEMLILMRIQGAEFTETASPDTKPADVCTTEQCFNRFQQIILSHSRQDPPGSLGVFRDSEVRLLTDFASITFFKHYLLYQYCINFDREIETLRFNPHVERPSAPPELSVGTKKTDRPAASRQKQAPENNHHAELNQEAPAEEEQVELTEEEKIEQLVLEKLRETEEKLQARLDQREAEFMQRAQEEGAGKKKGK